MDPSLLPTLYAWAVLLPLLSFFVIWIGANKLGKSAALIAVCAIGGSCLISFVILFGYWLPRHWPAGGHHGGHDEAHAADHAQATPAIPPHFVAFADEKPEEGNAAQPTSEANRDGHDKHDGHDKPGAAHADGHADSGHGAAGHESTDHGEHDHGHAAPPASYTGEYYTLGQFGPLRVTISYYIDTLTVLMFCMVTLIATLIHCYAMGYMSDELADVHDHEVTLSDGKHLHRPGRFPRFFQYLSLFCFSMLGLVLAGNIAMVFCFWELVGICSYFLIGFYVERKSASTAANKAFIVNRVGDFGMIIGLLAIWSTLGTFAFGDLTRTDAEGHQTVEPGIFSLVRPGPDHALIVPAGMVQADAQESVEVLDSEGNPQTKRVSAVAMISLDHALAEGGLANAEAEIASRTPGWRAEGYGYWILVVAGIGIFCGCVGKSAQFPLHTWLPDAMEGPTPVSALVHSATMVAAGVYLVGRFFPVFTPEVLLVIASIGAITMLLGASIAFTAVDIKRVLAYSTVSQLGLMMLALGVGGWAAGLMHLITHAFFKSLLFMCSGSVIHAVHTNDMRKMGGLWHKMPVTAITMLIGCLAIAGVSVPFIIGFSGYTSKDAILEQAYSLWLRNGSAWSGIYFVLALGGAAMTSCYMFRMWFMTFVGQPRDEHAYDHAHESPPIMHIPLVILAIFAVCVAWEFKYIGFFAIAALFFLARGFQLGWFKSSGGGHGHDHHGHDDHAHGHDDHGHAPAHSHADHGHAEHHHEPAAPPLTWAWTITMLVCVVVGGLIVEHGVLPNWVPEASPLRSLSLANLIESARPLGTAADHTGRWIGWTWPDEHFAHQDPQFLTIVVPVTLMATSTWLAGIFLAAALYWRGILNPADIRHQFAPIYTILWNKWYFDELYHAIFVKPTLVLSRFIAGIDKNWIDWALDCLASATVWFSKIWDLLADRVVVDGSINLLAAWTYSTGVGLRRVQTGSLRQYVMFIVIGAIGIFLLISFFWSPTLAR
ncbi:MAG: proton-conducting transporter membrane subunit [Pirellulaceae bacterium]|nr:proton-conducting transporter membrane subunit [Pirellulaceae bacterium]